MHEPAIEITRARACSKKIVDLCESFLVKHIVRPILFVLPPVLLTTAATRQALQKELEDLSGLHTATIFSLPAIILIILSYIYVVLIKAVYQAIQNYAKPEKEIERKDLIAILNAIGIVVGDKAKRMKGTAIKALASTSKVSGCDTFLEVTRPDQQIALLIAGINTVFQYMDTSKASYRVGLLKIVNNKPVEWVAYEPSSNPPRLQASELKSPCSTVSHCIKTKSIIVIDDIQEELKKAKSAKRFSRGKVQDSEQGSQLCYPIIHQATNRIEYVLTITGNRANCLSKKYQELYRWAINHFALRISMEHSLLIVKEKTDESAPTKE